ncbi:MAG: hypothetical protein ACRYFX_24710 [Janthinobacterium lividum]
MKLLPLLGLLALLSASPVLAQRKATPVPVAATFSFVALGDMPYNLPADYPRFERLITAINQQQPTPRFSVHVGDIKSGSTLCTEEMYQKVFNYFQTFEQPLIYTPGDNEWTDCIRPKAGKYDPEERLAVIRKMFFPDHNSFGKAKLVLTSQALMPGFATYVENNRWALGNIAFATVHLVGSNNNFVPNDPKGMNREFYDRQKANLAWLDAVFAEATAQHRLGVVLFTQADMWNFVKDAKDADGFTDIIAALSRLTVAFGRPVLLINGDSHRFLVDKPLPNPAAPLQTLQNFTRLQVPGEADVQAVRVTVDPSQAALFQIQELVAPGN